MRPERLYHITTSEAADAAAREGIYTPAAFSREGFIHCSYARQVEATANRIFRGQRNLALLEIDPDSVSARIVDENLEGGTELFPHIYGRLPMAAVKRIHPLACNEDGAFDFSALPLRSGPGGSQR
ncbi:MAG TPA: DUF952 domain-containing protein [Terriglobia bacterium]|nr:DUF952 domain-containing protein [Terriglobia bacterium]